MKRRMVWIAALLLATAAGGIVIVGCSSSAVTPITTTIEPGTERGRKLLGLASQEASKIPDADTRLTRLLNLADLQLQRGWSADAPATLRLAADTLRSKQAQTLSEHARISGWVSVSQLSRRCDDSSGALLACDGALAALRLIEDPGHRCEYVIGVCNELQYLKGKPVAAGLLVEAGPWTKSIDHVERRQAAVTAFASALFNLDDYDAGQKMMQYEPDAAWRSATLTALASQAQEGQRPMAMQRISEDTRGMSDAAMAPTQSFGRELSYERIFKGQKNSQTDQEKSVVQAK